MKKMLLISFVMVFAVSIAFSQFGIKAGMNLGTLGGDDKTQNGFDPKTKVGLMGGISYHIGLIAGLSVQPEVLYVQKGAIYEANLTAGNFYMNQKLTFTGGYIEIPVVARYNLPTPLVSPYIEGGLAYGFLLSAKQKEESTTNVPGEVSGTNDTDVKDQTTSSDFSIIIGIGVDILMFDVNARYVMGQTKIGKDSDLKIYNRGIWVTAGIHF
ncbi:MAG: PorT family protein [Ignavibacteriae bacterium]|nr:MAG: PorT family protein [Ignavibacteriota bacterium]